MVVRPDQIRTEHPRARRCRPHPARRRHDRPCAWPLRPRAFRTRATVHSPDRQSGPRLIAFATGRTVFVQCRSRRSDPPPSTERAAGPDNPRAPRGPAAVWHGTC